MCRYQLPPSRCVSPGRWRISASINLRYGDFATRGSADVGLVDKGCAPWRAGRHVADDGPTISVGSGGQGRERRADDLATLVKPAL